MVQLREGCSHFKAARLCGVQIIGLFIPSIVCCVAGLVLVLPTLLLIPPAPALVTLLCQQVSTAHSRTCVSISSSESVVSTVS